MGPLFAILTSVLSLAVYWYRPLVLERFDLLSRDLVFKLREAPPPPADVLVVAVDEQSIKRHGRWPWPRELQGRLIAALKEQGAAVVALDIIYLRPQDPHQDQALADALTAPGGPVVGGYFFRDDQTLPGSAVAMERLRESRIPLIYEAPGARPERILSFPFVETNQAELAAAFSTFGFFNYIPDPDGLIRSAPLVLGFGGDLYPSLPLAALAEYLGAPIRLRVSVDGAENVTVGEHSAPVDGLGRLAVNFYNGPQRIPLVSAGDVIEGNLPPEVIRGKVVFVGVTELGIADVRPTPVDHSFPGVGVHATVAGNILQGFHLYRDGRTILIDVAMMALIPLLMVLSMSQMRRVFWMTAAFVATLIGVWFLFYGIVTASGHLISLIYPAIATGVGYLAFQTYHILVTQRHSRYLRQAFSTYVAPALVEKLIENPDALALTGEKRVISVLFSDIRGFTTLSESLPAEVLVPVLNRYLGPMTDIVMGENGTLDKYIGDAVMALFNAPLDVPDHAERAARSAIRMFQGLEDLNRGFEKDLGLQLNIGIGIHTGEAVVGNMGSEARFDYTAIGDTVNLTSRLEGQTKAYGVGIIISEGTRHELGEAFAVRKLDRLRVKGKKEPVAIYQLFATPRDARLADLVERFEAGLERYFSGSFAEAIEVFEALLAAYPEDVPSRVFLARCRQFLSQPPDPDWGGVYLATEK